MRAGGQCTGWITLIGGGGWLDLAGLPRPTFDAIYATGNPVVVAGVFNPTGTAVAGPGDPVSLGEPFIQLLAAPKLNLAKRVGDHVTIKGKELTPEEAEHQAALHPDQQEANATAGGTGGRSERHLRYLRVQSIALSPGNCR